MKTLIIAFAMLTLVLSIGCAKKDDGGGGPPAGPVCGSNAVFSSAFNTCLSQGQCPPGLAVNPQQPTMCADIRTGMNVSPQQCGVGFFLTPTGGGCYAQGPCPQGQVLRGDVCVGAVSGSSGTWQQQMPTGSQFNQNGGGYNPYGNAPFNPYSAYYFR